MRILGIKLFYVCKLGTHSKSVVHTPVSLVLIMSFIVFSPVLSQESCIIFHPF